MEQIQTQKERINILTASEIINLHELLTNRYTLLLNMDPVSPPGIKDYNLLCSAVERQKTGSNSWFKYENNFNNAATLLYGVVKNHCFHNGNKRTGLLSVLKHLYHNGYVLKPELRHDEIYKFLIAVTESKLIDFINLHKNYNKWLKQIKLANNRILSHDQEIVFIESWLKTNSVSKNVQIKNKIKISYLRSILIKKKILLDQNGATIRLYKEEPRKLLLFKLKPKIVVERNYTLGNTMNEVNLTVLANIRRDFNLTHKDGIDNVTFYDDESFLDEEITNYRKIIYRLSKN